MMEFECDKVPANEPNQLDSQDFLTENPIKKLELEPKT